MTLEAFKLADDYAGTVDIGDGQTAPRYVGGRAHLFDRDVDIADLLAQGDGVIVVDTATGQGGHAAEFLRSRPELTPADVPADPPFVLSPYQDLSHADLRDHAAARGLQPHRSSDGITQQLIDDDHKTTTQVERADPFNDDDPSVPNADDTPDED